MKRYTYEQFYQTWQELANELQTELPSKELFAKVYTFHFELILAALDFHLSFAEYVSLVDLLDTACLAIMPVV